MFFNLAWRNSKRSRNENLIYFLTMVTAVAAFYIVLSLGAQDVIRFLSSLESDAVERLLTNLLPTVYVCALLFVFFLVVFANKYQLECRSRAMPRIKRIVPTIPSRTATSSITPPPVMKCSMTTQYATSKTAVPITRDSKLPCVLPVCCFFPISP